MNPLFDLVRERTQDLHRTAEATRREREFRGTTTTAVTQDHRPSATVNAAAKVEAGTGPRLPAERATTA